MPARVAPTLLFSLFAGIVGCGSTGADGTRSHPAPGDDDGGESRDAGAQNRAGDDSSASNHDGSDLSASDSSAGAGDGSSAADGAATDGGSGRNGILAPAQGALLGEYYGDGTIAETDARIGRKPAIHLTYYAWDDDWAGGSVTATDLSEGKIPLVNWEPDNIDFNQIVNGSLDATIQARASGAKKLGMRFFLDFAAEMNGDEAWSGNDAGLYVAAYRHIHDLFVAAGANNVVWAWCPNVTDVNGGNAMTMAYYPGDTYVDWTGVDGYNWGTSVAGFGWQSFHDVFAQIYPLLAAKGKPILIGEMASDEVGGDKGQWIAAIVPTLRADFPMIKGLVWFDVHKERQWQIDSSPASLAAYQTMAKDPYMN